MPQPPIILFDGICIFCNSAVNFVIKRDKNSILKFTTLQSGIAHQMLAHQNIPTNDLSSFVFIENEKIYTRSTAALRVCKYLTGLWPLMYGFIIVPRFLRDAAYKLIARNRYKWFGVKNECMVPTPDTRSRFLNK